MPAVSKLALIAFCIPLFASGKELAVKISGQAGPVSVERWKQMWTACEWEDGVREGHVSVVDHGGKKWLRVDFTPGEIGPEKGGCGWRFPIGKHEAAQLTYTVRFSKDFDWVKGGKLPGLCGGPANVSGGRPADGTNGFSSRLMWRREGRGEAYVYHKNQRDNYGDSFSFPGDFQFPSNTPIRVRMRVAMNESGRKNGKLDVWIRTGEGDSAAELQLVSRTDMEWRTVDSFAVDSLYFESFHGGNDRSWAPSRPCFAEFTDIMIVTEE